MFINILKSTTEASNVVLIVFDDMANEIISNRKVSPTVTELFNTGRKLNISTILFSNIKR